jgi:phosphate starvation-inducible protein PhoH and related proteins
MNLYHFGSIPRKFKQKPLTPESIPGYSGGNSNPFGADCQLDTGSPSEASNQCGARLVAVGADPLYNQNSTAWPAPGRARRYISRLMRKHLEITPNLEPLFGTRDENLRLMEDALQARIDLQSDAVQVEGSQDAITRVERIFQDYEALRKQGINLQNGELNGMLRLVMADPTVTLKSLAESGKQRSAGIKRMVQPRSINQRRYCEAIEQNDMVFGIGPAGTGKTYLAVAMGAAALLAKKVSRIVLVRPAVEAGERLGFLPGTLQEKVDPYLRPLYDALYDLIEPERVDKMLERNVIEVAPLAFMRGRTLNDAFIIMDEAQNTTSEQMKMFLTRMGNNAKAVITGDITQIDLPNPRKSGLVEALNILDGVEGIRFVRFADGDVVRHQLVQRVIRAYEGYGRQQQELPLAMGEGERDPKGEPVRVVRPTQ